MEKPEKIYKNNSKGVFTMVILNSTDLANQDHAIRLIKSKAGEGFDKPILMSGDSGVGKTSMARWLARWLLCKNHTPEGEPCNTCDMCQSVLQEKWRQEVEVWNASLMLKDNIREIIDKVGTPLMLSESTFRVILIEEAQDLLRNNRTAFLDLLEIEQDDTIFIFTTMDISAWDQAMRSRFFHVRFRSPSWEEMRMFVISELSKVFPEGMQGINEEVLFKLAPAAIASAVGTSYREADDFVDQIRLIPPQTEDELRQMLDPTGYNDIRLVVELALKKPEALEKLGPIGPKTGQVVTGLLTKISDLAFRWSKTVTEVPLFKGMSDGDKQRILQFIKYVMSRDLSDPKNVYASLVTHVLSDILFVSTSNAMMMGGIPQVPVIKNN